MRWSERQRAMLREMGIPPFWPVEAEPVEVPQAAAPSSMSPAADVGAGQPVAAPLAASTVSDPVSHRTPPTRSMPVAAQPVAVAELLDAAPRPARPSGIESMDWPALRAAVAGCQACGLCESRTQTVFGVGHIEAEWMIVGEAPGEEEDRQGSPFVGRAGQLLDRMLAAIDLTRSEDSATRQVFIANVLKCRPPANRNPLPQEVAQCEPYLLRQMALVRPKVILAMGRFAVQSLLKTSDAIGRLRGRVHEVQGIPVVVTYHPAYLLRNPADKALVWEDLCLAREVWREAKAGSAS
ncbi:uracil-DNA glycosylase [Aquabacterium sp.]|uniref:uracil-DNA glycosylase n=1 Tax=Aquabacterium sp. TaxID=1872578 RepID=UPI002E306EC7|nr:uracil-DNA glycosylase family protein [Aquabacterium sp.]HEX5311442.1 uracil-DNA glycosylase family protein [Aquabacterium sp.]